MTASHDEVLLRGEAKVRSRKLRGLFIAVLIVIIFPVVLLVYGMTDRRLDGTYAPDYEGTLARWAFGRQIGVVGVSNVFSQVFGDGPITISGRSIMSGGPPVNREIHFVRLYGGSDRSVLLVGLRTVLIFEYEGVDVWCDARSLSFGRAPRPVLRFKRLGNEDEAVGTPP